MKLSMTGGSCQYLKKFCHVILNYIELTCVPNLMTFKAFKVLGQINIFMVTITINLIKLFTMPIAMKFKVPRILKPNRSLLVSGFKIRTFYCYL